jgi:glycerol uptake facilitator-like aquaporin
MCPPAKIITINVPPIASGGKKLSLLFVYVAQQIARTKKNSKIITQMGSKVKKEAVAFEFVGTFFLVLAICCAT